MSFEAPRGYSATPKRSPAARRSTSLCSSAPELSGGSDHGLRELRRNDPKYLLGTAPIFDMEPPGEQRRARSRSSCRFSTSRSTSRSRCGPADDYGLRFTVSNITQKTPLAAANLTFWGFPREAAHDSERFAKGAPGDPAGCPGLPTSRCIATPTPSPHSTVHPLTDNPTTCTGAAAGHQAEVQTYQDPGQLSRSRQRHIRRPTGAKTRPSNRFCRRVRRRPRPTPRPASTSSCSAPSSSASRPRRRRSGRRSCTLPGGPDDQSRRCGRPERLHGRPGELRQRGPRRMPRQRQDRHFEHRIGGARRPARGLASTSANRSRATSTGSS